MPRFLDDYRNVSQTPPAATDFFKEMLMTYRLLFGKDKHSWKLCRRLLRKEIGGWFFQRWWRVIWSSKARLEEATTRDLLLRKLCCSDADDVPMYDDLDIPGARTLYSPQQDFPFFGTRLATLQEHTRMLQPYNLWTLWWDRRDPNRFYTIRALVIFSIITLILALLGLGLSAAQVASAFKPPDQSATS